MERCTEEDCDDCRKTQMPATGAFILLLSRLSCMLGTVYTGVKLAGNTVTSVRPLVPEFSFVLMKTCETLSADDVIERPTSGDSEPHITTIPIEEYLGTLLIDVY